MNEKRFVELAENMVYDHRIGYQHIRCLFFCRQYGKWTDAGMVVDPAKLPPLYRRLLGEFLDYGYVTNSKGNSIFACKKEVTVEKPPSPTSIVSLVAEAVARITGKKFSPNPPHWVVDKGQRKRIPGDVARLNHLKAKLNSMKLDLNAQRSYIAHAVEAWHRSSIKGTNNMVGFIVSPKILDLYIKKNKKEMDIAGFVDDRQKRINEWSSK